MTQRSSSMRLLSRQEVEDIYGISKRFLEKAVCNGTGPNLIRVGRLVRYRPSDIEDWIAGNCIKGVE